MVLTQKHVRKVIYSNWGKNKIIPTVRKQLYRKDKQIQVNYKEI